MSETEEPQEPESVSIEEAIAGFGDNPPDGFVVSMIFWKREPSDPKHPIHNFLEMLKTNFLLQLSKRDVVMKDLHYYQVDMFWYGPIEHIQSTLEEIDKIIQQTLPSMEVTPSMNIGFCMLPPNAEPDNPDDDIF